MILFEHEDEGGLRITNEQFAAVIDLVNEFGWTLGYDVIPHENGRTIHVWVHHGPGQNPTRHHISANGIVFLHEDVDWDWSGEERKRS